MLEFIKMLFQAIKEFLATQESIETPIEKPPVHNRNELLLDFAAKEIGVKEIAGDKNNPQVLKYHAYARQDNDLSKAQPDSVPWCASFICYCLEMVGMGSTNSMAARSFLEWGISSKADPIPGDLVVFWRGTKTGWEGHVSIFLEKNDTTVICLGGNQTDAVTIAQYPINGPKMGVLDYRRSSKLGDLDSTEVVWLKNVAGRIMAKKPVNLGDKVV